MNRCFRKSGRVTTLARASLGLFCLCAFGMVFGRNAAEAAQGTLGGASGFSPRFAIADFDGDRKPDVATVQVVRQAATESYYFIRLELSAGEASAIGITGPQGGLRLEARDVNGDDATDLIVTTAMDSRFVAVLLNDGHGRFTLAKAGAFPNIERDEGIRLSAAHGPTEECAALQLTRSTFGVEALYSSGTGPDLKSESPLAGNCGASLTYVWRGKPGRSPPFVVFHS